MALSGLDIYKLLPKTNCRKCGFSTCLAFAMALAKKQVELEKCPFISPEVKSTLLDASLPPVRLVTIGTGENKIEVGNETVLFRHEEKFYRPPAIGFILKDTLNEKELTASIKKAESLKYERIGQEIKIGIIAIQQKGSAQNFIDKITLVSKISSLPLVLITHDAQALKGALEVSAKLKPLVYPIVENNIDSFIELAKSFGVPLVLRAPELEKLEELTQKAKNAGVEDLILDTADKPLAQKIEDLTFIRRLALKKKRRSLGYPVLVNVQNDDPVEETQEAGVYIAKYASIILLKTIESWQSLALLTLRQNIYTDPQKPLQVEPKVYDIGQVSNQSPVIITTNFSLTYYTVLGEIEASKIPCYLLSVDTEGMSVLTAWAAEKFTPEKITESLGKSGIKDRISHNNMIIPGYVSVMSGDLEEKSGYKIIVGPKEASGLTSFLKNL